MIGIIDYGAGNLYSVQKALNHLGLANLVISDASEVTACDKLLLPGVGHFGSAMTRLQASAMVPALQDWLTLDRPFLGICLGMQMLFSTSAEAPGIKGLDFFKGHARPYTCRPRLQIGWNMVHATRPSAIWQNTAAEYHYYVNGYHVVPVDRNIVAATSDYGGEFTAAVQSGRIWGVQFHPEKSAASGLDLLERWGDIMIATRIIPCLDVDCGRVVKGVAFKNIREVGDPVEMARRYYQQGADELAFLDIGATFQSRKIMVDIVERVSREIFIPMTVGGGLRTVEDIRRILRAGADKVSLGSAALADPKLVTRAADRFGSQCVVLSIDARSSENGWRVYSHGGRRETEWEAVAWARCGESLGAGEILLNSIDRDGTGQGYDLELLGQVADAVSIPVIASGGAGRLEQLPAAVFQGQASAILLASLLHDGVLTIPKIKEYLLTQGVHCR